MHALAMPKPATMQELWEAALQLKQQYEAIGKTNTPHQGWTIPQRKAIEAVKSMEAALDAELPALAAKMLLAVQIEQTWSEYPGYASLKEVIEGELTRMTYTAFNGLLNLYRVVIPGLQQLGLDPLPYLTTVKETNWFEITPALRYLLGSDSEHRPVSPTTQSVVDTFLAEARQIAPESDEGETVRAVTERLLDAAQKSNASLRRMLRPGAEMEFWLVDGRFVVAEIKSEEELSAFLRRTAGWSDARQIESNETRTVPTIKNLLSTLSREADYAD